MKKIIILLIGCIGAFMMTDADALFSRLLTAPKTILSKRTYFTGRVMQNDTINKASLNNTSNESAVQQELNKRSKSVAELESEKVMLELQKDRLIALYEQVLSKPFDSK